MAPKEEVREQAKVAFKTALLLANNEGRLVWIAFTSLLMTNTAIIALGGAVLKWFSDIRLVVGFIGFAGVLLCIIWFSIIRRHFAYYHYLFTWMRYLESQFLPANMCVVNVGKTYCEGGTLEKPPTDLKRFGWSARVFTVQWLMISALFLIGGRYIFLIVASFIL